MKPENEEIIAKATQIIIDKENIEQAKQATNSFIFTIFSIAIGILGICIGNSFGFLWLLIGLFCLYKLYPEQFKINKQILKVLLFCILLYIYFCMKN